MFDQVARDLVEIPEVLECHLISGEFDYLVKARLKEMSAYRRLLGDLLKAPRFGVFTQLCGYGRSERNSVFRCKQVKRALLNSLYSRFEN